MNIMRHHISAVRRLSVVLVAAIPAITSVRDKKREMTQSGVILAGSFAFATGFVSIFYFIFIPT